MFLKREKTLLKSEMSWNVCVFFKHIIKILLINNYKEFIVKSLRGLPYVYIQYYTHPLKIVCSDNYNQVTEIDLCFEYLYDKLCSAKWQTMLKNIVFYLMLLYLVLYKI